MRKAIETQLKIGEIPISNIKIDLHSRDEIPKVLLGLQRIYQTESVREDILKILSELTPKNISRNKGRIGMTYWQIFTLGILRLVCNWDYDQLREIANNHWTVRQMLGLSPLIDLDFKFGLQTLKDNLHLFTPEILSRVNQVVVKFGHREFGKEEKLMGRCDSSVVKTNVHYPTDINLLLDAINKVIILSERVCSLVGFSDWRQSKYHLKAIKRSYQKAQRLKHSTSTDDQKKQQRVTLIQEAYQNYLNLAENFLQKVLFTEDRVNKNSFSKVVSLKVRKLLLEIRQFRTHAKRQIDQIRRRVLQDEKIPHSEKVFSVFEPHTEWISKGKAGVPQELGHRVSIIEDQNRFILHHRVMIGETDDKVAVLLVRECKQIYNNFVGCSFDKGYYSPKNRTILLEELEHLTMPKKGRLSKKDQAIEYSEEFIQRRKQHSAVESAIHALQNHGMDLCPDQGLTGFKRYVGLAILARNIEMLGAKVQRKKCKQAKRNKRYNKTRQASLKKAA